MYWCVCVCEYEMRLKEIPRRTVVVVVFVLIVHLLPSPEPRGQCTLAQVHLKPKMPSISIASSYLRMVYEYVCCGYLNV